MEENQTKREIVLAIYTTYRGFGFVVFEGSTEPIDWGVKEITKSRRDEIYEKFDKLIVFYAPSVLVLEHIEGSRRGTKAKRLINALATRATRRGITVHRYSRNAVKSVFAQFHATTKYEIAKAICTWLPALAPRMPRSRRPWMSEDYRMGIFDAIALALTHYYITS